MPIFSCPIVRGRCFFSYSIANNRGHDPVRSVGWGRTIAGVSRSLACRDRRGRGMPETTISLDGHDEELAVFGSRDQYLRQVRDALGVKVLARHGEVRVEGDGDRVEQARQVFEELATLYRRARGRSARATWPT